MANEDIGEIVCAWCNDTVPVRKDRNGKLYPACDNCGQQKMNAKGGQAILLERATIWGRESLEPFAHNVTEPEPVTAPPPPPPPEEPEPVDVTEEPEPMSCDTGFGFMD